MLTIIYVPTRKDAEQIASFLKKEFGTDARPYHAKLPKSQLISTHTSFRDGSLDCVVATVI